MVVTRSRDADREREFPQHGGAENFSARLFYEEQKICGGGRPRLSIRGGILFVALYRRTLPVARYA